MKTVIAATAAMLLAISVASAPASAQLKADRSAASRELHIPSDQQLEREVFSEPRNNFSSIDAVADGEMDRMDREIDRLVERGICDGC